MKPFDYAKAALAGFVAMGLNFLLTVPVILVCRFFVFAGRDETFYKALPTKVAPWSAWICGPIIFFGLACLLGRRRPERNPFLFVAVAWAAYVATDVALSAPMGGLKAMLTLAVLAAMTANLAGAMIGAWLASRKGKTP
jgi:hypothetical protein